MDARSLRLPAILDLGAAKTLWSDLVAARGRPLCVDASEVERIGGLCLQLLIAAEAQWSEDGQTFVIENLSAGYADNMAMMLGEAAMSSEKAA